MKCSRITRPTGKPCRTSLSVNLSTSNNLSVHWGSSHARRTVRSRRFHLVFTASFSEAGIPCIIYSGDNDLLQLTDEKTSVRITVKGVKEIREYTPATILEEFGLTAHQLIDVKALKGDTSDNIPGVRGIGEKTALKLVQEFGSVETLLENGGPERYRALIAENRDIILRNRSLVTIQMVLDEPTTLSDLDRRPPDVGLSVQLFPDTVLRDAEPACIEGPRRAIAPVASAPVHRDDLFNSDAGPATVVPDPVQATNAIFDEPNSTGRRA